MKRFLSSLVIGLFMTVFVAPVASAGPFSQVCLAAQRAYEKTGKDAPFECLM